MKKNLKNYWLPTLILMLGVMASMLSWITDQPQNEIYGAPPYGETKLEVPSLGNYENAHQDWKRPETPPRVGLQVGHLNNDEVPEELKVLRGNTGATGGGYTEAQINQVIAEKTADILRSEGIIVDVLPATVPPQYWADAFIAIHADGSTNKAVSGFKIAGPWRDLTGNSHDLVKSLENSYRSTTKMRQDDNITSNMRGYYAFSWWRYDHAIHPMTTAAIVETGFLTNASDRRLIAENPEVSAQAIAAGVIDYLTDQELIS